MGENFDPRTPAKGICIIDFSNPPVILNCPRCGKNEEEFSRPDVFMKHVKHSVNCATPKTPLTTLCSNCNHNFSSSSNLKKHLKSEVCSPDVAFTPVRGAAKKGTALFSKKLEKCRAKNPTTFENLETETIRQRICNTVYNSKIEHGTPLESATEAENLDKNAVRPHVNGK